MYWRDSLQCPTEEEYLSMVNNSKWYHQSWIKFKSYVAETGGLLRLAIKLMMVKSGSDVSVMQLHVQP
jgi:geranylgeranyl diphosphate synthase type 3